VICDTKEMNKMKSRNSIILGAVGVALLLVAALSSNLAELEGDADRRATSAGQPRNSRVAKPRAASHTGHGNLDRRVRGGPDHEDDENAPVFAVAVREGAHPSKSELEWDGASSEERRARASEAVARALGGDVTEEQRAEAAQLLATTRADFFTSEEGRAEFFALEQSIGD
jgi:hypothetical protein